jgi:tetratricopeptide (TPR) repeat protein
VKRLALALVLAAGVADANVWQHAVDRGTSEAKADLYEAALRKGDDAAGQARMRGSSVAQIHKLVDRAIEAYRTAAAAKPNEGEPWWRIGEVIYQIYFECDGDPLLPRPSLMCDLPNYDRDRAEQMIAAWDTFEQRSPLDPRLSSEDTGHVLFERAIAHTKLIEGADAKTVARHLEASAHDYEKILERMTTESEQGLAYERVVGNLAETYMMIGRLDDAVDMYREATQHGARPSTVYGYAVALDRNDRGEVAKEKILGQGIAGVEAFYKEVRDKGAFFVPEGEVFYYYALLNETFGNNSEAMDNWRKYIRSGAHPEFQPRAKEHLDALMSKRIKREVPHLNWADELMP